MILNIDYNFNPESFYYDARRNNHIIPKVYYKQWIDANKYSKNNAKLKILNKNDDIYYKNLNKFNTNKNAFVIKFGDTFLPNIVKKKFMNITKNYKFFYQGKEYFDIDVLSNNYYLFDKWTVINNKGKPDKHGFQTQISKQSCYSIEVGLDVIFENFYIAIINTINELFGGKSFDSSIVQIVIDYIIRIYLCFYLRSDAWKDLSYSMFDSIADIYINTHNIPKIDNVREKLHEDLRREYLWMLLYDYNTFVNSFERFFKSLRYKNIRIYKNNTDEMFGTSKSPIINNGKNVFFVMTPKYIIEFVDDFVDEYRILLFEIVDNKFVIERNNEIKEKEGELIVYN